MDRRSSGRLSFRARRCTRSGCSSCIRRRARRCGSKRRCLRTLRRWWPACDRLPKGRHYKNTEAQTTRMATPATQTYANHRHNPKMSGIGFMFLFLSIVAFALRWFQIGGRYTMALGLIGLLGAVQILLAISRVYTTKLQDRIIKLEMKVRAL